MKRNVIARTTRGIAIAALMLAGETGNAVPPMPTRPPIENVEVAADGSIYAMTAWSGVYRKNGDRPWSKVIDNKDMVSGRIINLSDGSLIFTSFSGQLSYRSEDHGVTWSEVGESRTLPGFGKLDAWVQPRFLALTKKGKVFALTGRTLLVSIDGGRKWHTRDLPSGETSSDLERQAIAANDKEVFILVDGILHRSVDDGRSWKMIKQSTESPLAIGDGVMPFLRIGLGGKLLAVRRVMKHNALFTSGDGGRTWSVERFGMPAGSTFDVQLYDFLPESAYLLLNGGPGGVSVTSAYRYVPGKPLVEVGFNPSLIRRIIEAPQGNLYLVDFNGDDVYRSNDEGKSWAIVSRDGLSP